MFVEEEIDHSQLNFQPRAQVYFVSEWSRAIVFKVQLFLICKHSALFYEQKWVLIGSLMVLDVVAVLQYVDML